MTSTKTVYIVLTDTGTLFTKTIKAFTQKPYNHASIAFDRRLQDVYSFGRKKLTNPLRGGLIKENYDDHFYRQTQAAIFACTLNQHDYDNIYRRVQRMYRHPHKFKYNLLGLFGILFHKRIERAHAFFCSQFVAHLFESIDSPL